MVTVDKNPPKDLSTYPLFYQKVWKACCKIPVGSVMTYGELARAIGHPRAARAVGQALAKNPFAPRVPCHRVVASGNAIGGYSGSGGVMAKKALLKKEKALRNG